MVSVDLVEALIGSHAAGDGARFVAIRVPQVASRLPIGVRKLAAPEDPRCTFRGNAL